MQAVRHCPGLRRSYATTPSTMPHMAKVARTASAPLAVRLRRRKQFGKTPAGATDATENGLTPSDKATYDRLKLLKNCVGPDPWFPYCSARGPHMTDVVGQKVYLPNIVMRLVRNHTPPGQPYNPYEATFRIPQSVTKTDVRSLLLAVYGTYKRAVVGLVEPFYYPQRLEDMEPEARKEREEFIERNFAIQHTRNLQKEELLRLTKGQGRMSWKFKAPYATKRSHIIRLVSERRAARENLVADFASGMRELREEGKFNYKMLKARVKPPPPSSESVPPPSSDAPSSRIFPQF
ncbi:hypothetical protein BJ912DRAFT_944909 [Pholiota molesta]|nr:hypothetical protein BJ912DRAFT_944909 [Pholiota molesta]